MELSVLKCCKPRPSFKTTLGRWLLILFLVDSFSGWPESFVCCTNKTQEVTEILLKEIIPRLGVPLGLSSDREFHSVAETVQSLCKVLGSYMEFPHSLETSVQWKNKR